MGTWWLSLALAGSAFQPGEAKRLYDEGVALYNQAQYEQALELLQQAAARESGVPDYRYHLGLAYLKVGEAKKAASELESALGMMGMRRETRVKEPFVLLQAAIAYFRAGNSKAARARVEDAIDREVGEPDAYYILGLIDRDEGADEEAAKSFAMALELDRDHPEANLALAEWYETQGQVELARENLRHASHGTTENFDILMALGATSFRLGAFEEAEAAFMEALSSRPDDDDSRFNLGTVRLSGGDPHGAIEALTVLEARDEPNDRAAFNLALALQQVDDGAGARAVLERLTGRSPSFPGAWFSLGIVAEQAADQDAAEDAYRRSLRDAPSFVPAYLNLAALLEATARVEEALSVLRDALDLEMDEAQSEAVRTAMRILEGVEPEPR